MKFCQIAFYLGFGIVPWLTVGISLILYICIWLNNGLCSRLCLLMGLSYVGMPGARLLKKKGFKQGEEILHWSLSPTTTDDLFKSSKFLM